MGFTLLIAVGTLTFITLVHILPEVFFQDGHEDHDHFDDGNNESLEEKTDYRELSAGEADPFLEDSNKSKEDAAADSQQTKLIGS